MIVPVLEQLPRLLATILKAREDPDHKIMVFFVAARVVQASALPLFLFLSLVSTYSGRLSYVKFVNKRSAAWCKSRAWVVRSTRFIARLGVFGAYLMQLFPRQMNERTPVAPVVYLVSTQPCSSKFMGSNLGESGFFPTFVAGGLRR